jgi:hypothetical protein
MLAVSALIEKEKYFAMKPFQQKMARTSEKACEYLGNHHCNYFQLVSTLSEGASRLVKISASAW